MILLPKEIEDSIDALGETIVISRDDFRATLRKTFEAGIATGHSEASREAIAMIDKLFPALQGEKPS